MIVEIQGISARRVQQIYKEYVADQPPQVGNKPGRPHKELSSYEKKLVYHAYSDYSLKPVTLS